MTETTPGAAREDLTVLLLDADRYPENPYMSLQAAALRERGVTVRSPSLPFFFPLTRTALRHPDADVSCLNWVYDYYSVTETGVTAIDRVATWVRAGTLLVDLLVVSLLPVALVWTVHNVHHHERRYPRTERVVNETLFAVADAVTVMCPAAAERVAAAYLVPSAADLHVVPDGSYVSAYENRVSESTARERLSIPPESFVYLYFGLVREYKGIPSLIAAFRELETTDAELWVVGSPANDAIAEEVAALADGTANVEAVLEFVPDERIQEYLNAADVLVLPYRDILNSGTAHLGGSFGLPVVAPRIGCLPETLSPANDLLYDPEDPDGLRRALERAREHEDLEGIGRANYDNEVADDWSATAEAMVGVFRAALERAAPDGVDAVARVPEDR